MVRVHAGQQLVECQQVALIREARKSKVRTRLTSTSFFGDLARLEPPLFGLFGLGALPRWIASYQPAASLLFQEPRALFRPQRNRQV